MEAMAKGYARRDLCGIRRLVRSGRRATVLLRPYLSQTLTLVRTTDEVDPLA